MDDHAKAVADRWAKKRAAVIADGKNIADFDRDLLALLYWGGWSEEDAQAIVNRVKRLSEKGVNE